MSLPRLLLPAPVWPTRAMPSPGGMCRSKPASTCSWARVAEVHLLELDLAAPAGRAATAAFWRTVGSASISAKMRSEADRPACTWLQKAESWAMGNQKRSTLVMKRYQAPKVMAPAAADRPPK